jgi:hypothetical protein
VRSSVGTDGGERPEANGLDERALPVVQPAFRHARENIRVRFPRFAPAIAIAVSALVLLVAILLIRGLTDTGTALRSTPSVVVAVRDLARLESVEFHVERVIDLRDRQSLLFGLIRTQDAILFVAVGEVTAGVDLGELKDEDVTADRAKGSATVRLPPARVLSARLDNARSWVFSRTTDVLAQRRENLETRARQEAERTLEDAALDGGILERARTNAERTVESLVRSLGYSTVTVTTRDAPRP